MSRYSRCVAQVERAPTRKQNHSVMRNRARMTTEKSSELRVDIPNPQEQRHAECKYDADFFQSLFHGKWRFVVLQELARQPMRLSALRRAIPGCSKKMLIETLHRLETSGLIERVEYATTVKKVEYSLAQNISDDLRRLIESVSSRKTLTP